MVQILVHLVRVDVILLLVVVHFLSLPFFGFNEAPFTLAARVLTRIHLVVLQCSRAVTVTAYRRTVDFESNIATRISTTSLSFDAILSEK